MKLAELFILEFVVPAIKTENGKLLIGEKGQMHLHVYEKHKQEIYRTKFESGFYDTVKKKFMTREETYNCHGFACSEHSPEFLKKHGEKARYVRPSEKEAA